MKPAVKNVLAIVAGWILGSVVNLSLVNIGHMIMPIDGVDPNDMEALAEVMPTLDPSYFIFPFLAHALGTLVGALIAGLIAASHKKRFSLAIGFIFLLGGIVASMMIPAPTWFVIIDIVVAYIPMAWIGSSIAQKMSK